MADQAQETQAKTDPTTATTATTSTSPSSVPPRPDGVTAADLMDRLTTAGYQAMQRSRALTTLVSRTRDLEKLLARPMTNKRAQANAIAIQINGLEHGLDLYPDLLRDNEREAVLWLIEEAREKAKALGLTANLRKVSIGLDDEPERGERGE